MNTNPTPAGPPPHAGPPPDVDPTRDVIEQAARIIDDNAQALHDPTRDVVEQVAEAAYARFTRNLIAEWDDVGEKSRDNYRRFARRLAAAGLLATGPRVIRSRAELEALPVGTLVGYANAPGNAGSFTLTRHHDWAETMFGDRPFRVVWVIDLPVEARS